MESHIHEWANLLIRWIHFIVGTAWIGASFYFNWLENNLDRRPGQEEGIAGNLWAVHGGGFYHLKKFSTGPNTLPTPLHWFKWEAYTTWLSGFTLLIVAYYYNAELFLVDAQRADIAPGLGILIGVTSMLASWILYDLLCKSRLQNQPTILSALILLYFAVLSFTLCSIFTGRAAYIHIGSAIGTIMVANVFFVIIPAQKEMVLALSESRTPDPKLGKSALLRSRHNNYFTLPVLFIMVSSHFPSTYGHNWNWLILLLLSVISVLVRHYFNVRHRSKHFIWILPLAFFAFAGVMWMTSPDNRALQSGSASAPSTDSPAPASSSQIVSLIQSRCSSCHAAEPIQAGFSAPPAGLMLERESDILANAQRIYQTTVVTKIMPLGNITGITNAEREQLRAWYLARTGAAE